MLLAFREPGTPRRTGWLAVAAGCVLSLLAALSLLSTRSFVRRAAHADAIVVALNAGSAHPQVEFALVSGEKLSFPAGGFISYNKGARAKVLYMPEAPIESVRLDDFGALWLPDIVQAFMGIVFLGVGFATVPGRRRRESPPAVRHEHPKGSRRLPPTQ